MMERKEKKNRNLPERWKTAKLADLFEIKQGKSLSAKKQTGKSLKPFLRTSNVLWGKLDLSEIDQMDFSEKECSELALKYDDLLVCEGGDIGRTAIWRNEIEECYCQNHIHRLRARGGNIHPLFIMYWLRAGITQLKIYEGFANKTTIPNLSRSRLSEFIVPLPEIDEQKKIAGILHKIQQAIEAQDEIIKKTKELKKSTMQFLFTRGLYGEKTKQTEIGEMPDSWDVGKIGNYCQKPTYGYTESAKYEIIGPKFLRITDITEKGVNWETVPYCNCSEEKFKQYELKEDDILFARIGATTGKSFIIKNPPKAVYASYLIRLRADGVDPDYLHYFFDSEVYWQQIMANKANNLKGGVNASVLSSLLFPLPQKKEEQKEIAKILNIIDRKIIYHDSKKTILQHFFNSMLNKLMTGEIRI